MTSFCENGDRQLLNCLKAEIILNRKDDDTILLWKCKNENQWELPCFLLKENESFREGLQRWCTNQLLVSDIYVWKLHYKWCILVNNTINLLTLRDLPIVICWDCQVIMRSVNI